MEKYYLSEKIESNLGFILSYGDCEDLYPVGIYKPSYVYKQDENKTFPITFNTMLTDEDSIIFSKYNDENDIEDFIIIPAENTYNFLDREIIDFNTNQLLYSGKDVVEVYEFVEDVIKEYNETPINDLITYSLEQVDAIKTINGELSGNNYSIMPISMPCKIKEKIKTKEFEKVKVFHR